MTLALAFDLAGDRFAAPIGPVEEILPWLPVEPVPSAPAFLRGVVFVRGHLVPIIDGAERLGMARPGPAPEDPKIIAFSLGGRLIGLVVDDVADLIDLPETGRAPATDLYLRPGAVSALVEHEGRLYRLIDPERLLAREEVAAIPAATPA